MKLDYQVVLDAALRETRYLPEETARSAAGRQSAVTRDVEALYAAKLHELLALAANDHARAIAIGRALRGPAGAGQSVTDPHGAVLNAILVLEGRLDPPCRRHVVGGA